MECCFLVFKHSWFQKGGYGLLTGGVETVKGRCPSCSEAILITYTDVELYKVGLGLPHILADGSVVSAEVLQALKEAGVKGLQPKRTHIFDAAEDSATGIDDPNNDERIARMNYHSLGDSGLNLVLLANRMRPLIKKTSRSCPSCVDKEEILRYPPRIVVDWSTWNGADYFFISCLDNGPFMTGRFIEVLKKFHVEEMYDIVPLDETSDKHFFNVEFGLSPDDEIKRHRPGDPWPPEDVPSR